jgi:hypothetical protein
MTPNTDNPDKPRPQENEGVASGVYKPNPAHLFHKPSRLGYCPQCTPQANQGDDELHQYLDECHLGDVEQPQSMNPMQRETFEAWLLAWHHRQLAERLQMVLDNPLLQNEPNHYGGLDYTPKKEHRNELRHYIRELITKLMPKEAS